ncbi:MAG TPA: type II toxin-antitoxin system VapC family toxin [Acidobacteriaceae bacterium]|nr:type II toxin-antitoxin system VapC family toxin [Acidobacteriaceae bacterium]
MSRVVFDASAILAAANNEPGADIVLRHTADSIVSTVNLAEAHGRLVERRIPAKDAWDAALSFCHEVVSFDTRQARLAGDMVAATQPVGLSLGGRACLALATLLKPPVHTTDRMWKRLPFAAEVRLLRQQDHPVQ